MTPDITVICATTGFTVDENGNRWRQQKPIGFQIKGDEFLYQTLELMAEIHPEVREWLKEAA